MNPTDKAARIAGAVYVSMLFTGPFSLIYVPTKLIVRGDATATAANVLAHEMLFRFGIVAIPSFLIFPKRGAGHTAGACPAESVL